MKPTAFPVLRYADARAAIDWLIQAFGFQKVSEFEGPSGTVAHAELKFGPSTTASAPQHLRRLTTRGHTCAKAFTCADDIDARYEKAKRAGTDIIIPLRDTDYGSRTRRPTRKASRGCSEPTRRVRRDTFAR